MALHTGLIGAQGLHLRPQWQDLFGHRVNDGHGGLDHLLASWRQLGSGQAQLARRGEQGAY